MVKGTRRCIVDSSFPGISVPVWSSNSAKAGLGGDLTHVTRVPVFGDVQSEWVSNGASHVNTLLNPVSIT